MDWRSATEGLFPQGHDVVEQRQMLLGSGRSGSVTFTVIGTTGHAEVGVEISLAMATAVLDTVRRHSGRPILFLMDTQGQKLTRRDEMLGLNSYMAHLGKCVAIARQRGHKILGLVYDQALSGGFIASAMGADVCGAVPEAEIRVMNLPAMARVTRIPEERLRELSKSSPVFAPGAVNYVRMGALDGLWDGDLAARLLEALDKADGIDHRAQWGLERGGRELALSVAQRVARDG
jgi:malonate decarboxylase gamma subunit